MYIAHSHPRRHELKHATGHQSPRRAARRLCVRRSPGCCARSHARLRRCWRGDSADPRRRRSASEAAARVVDLRMHRQGGQGVQHRRGAQDPRRRGTAERHRNRRQLRRESSLSERASLCEKATPRSLSQKRRRSTASTVPSAHTPRHATSHPTRHTTPLRIDAPRSPQLTAAAPRVAASGDLRLLCRLSRATPTRAAVQEPSPQCASSRSAQTAIRGAASSSRDQVEISPEL